MIIDSQQYNGPCSCGRTHTMETLFSVVESGALKKLASYLEEYHLYENTVAVYDGNTYRATKGRHPKADHTVILPPEGLHADEHGVALLQSRLPKEAKVLIAIGSGTIHDITRYCAYELGASFVSCPTAASVDGFCSSVAAMTWKGCKKTLTAVAPTLVVADLDIIKAAPLRLARAGFGDMIGKYIALTDWRIAHLLNGEFYCERIAELTAEATDAVCRSADGLMSGEEAAFEKLMYGLLLSGLAMQMMGNSRPASGAEHHISHLIEMGPAPLGLCSDALHGEKVGVATLLALKEYRRIANRKGCTFKDYGEYDETYIAKGFGARLTEEILLENAQDSAKGITAKALEQFFEQIAVLIEALPEEETLAQIYQRNGILSTLPEIGVAEEKLPLLLKYSPCVRNRVTLMRLKKCIGESV